MRKQLLFSSSASCIRFHNLSASASTILVLPLLHTAASASVVTLFFLTKLIISHLLINQEKENLMSDHAKMQLTRKQCGDSLFKITEKRKLALEM